MKEKSPKEKKIKKDQKDFKRKSVLGTYIKRFLLIIVALFIVIFASVYFLDRYKTSGMKFENEYPDSYWENLEANGFVHSSQFVNIENTGNVDLPTYEPPYSDDDDFVTRLKKARYYRELEDIYTKTKALAEYGSYPDQSLFEETYNEKAEELRNITYTSYVNDYCKERKVFENDRFIFYFDMITTNFKLCEKDDSGKIIETWYSIPQDITANDLGDKKSILTVSYVDGSKESNKRETILDSYTFATFNDPSEAKEASFYVNIIEDENGNATKLQVYYIMNQKGFDYTWFPTQLTKERFQELFNRCNERVAQYRSEHNNAYEYDSKGNMIDGLGFLEDMGRLGLSSKTQEFIGRILAGASQIYEKDRDNPDLYKSRISLDKLSASQLDDLYLLFYEWIGYTSEDLLEDTGTILDANHPRVELAIEYQLAEDGLSIMIPGNSVKTNKNSKGDSYLVNQICLLPYFNSVRTNTEQGYMIVPDGSGAIMNFDSDRTAHKAYTNKRIYTTDLTLTSEVLQPQTSDVLLPMYAFVYTTENKQKAFIAEVTEGEPQVKMYVDIARSTNPYNYANFTIVYREMQDATLGGGQYYRNDYKAITNQAASGDYRFSYHYLDPEIYEISYSGVAKCYRDILISRSEGKLNGDNDQTTKAVLDLEVLGAYSYDTNFLGISYEGKDTLTTVSQLKEILDEILQIDFAHVNVYYKGWRTEGMKNVSFKSIKVSSKIGGKKALLDLINQYQNEVTIYPYVEFLEYEKYQESFGSSHYTSRNVSGEYATKYPYDLQSNLYDKKANKINVLSPAYYNAFSNELAKNYQKVLGINTMAISGLGSQLSGNYRKNNNVFKSAAVFEQIKAFENLRNKGITNLALESPYAYAIEYATNIYNLPYDSSQEEIFNYSIPFYQLIINGMVDYSGEVINENINNGIDYHIMKCIETGSNPSFVFTYDDSSELLQTDYNNYYFTLYSRWMSDVKNVCDTLNGLEIYALKLVKHEYLANGVFKVTYENSDASVHKEFVLNYNYNTWSGNGLTVPANSYIVL